MSSDNIFPSISVQNTELSISNNSYILYNFLIGNYTTVYLGTLYLYLTRKAPQRVIVIISITLLYLIGVIQFAVQWVLVQYNFIQTSSGAETAFMSMFNYPIWSHITIDVTSFLMFVVADGLLIWRCYNVWGRCYRVIVLPSFLLLVEVALSLSSIIYILAVHSNPEGTEVNIINNLQSSVFFVSFATSLSTTVLIAYRIHVSSKDMSDISFSTSKARFTHIIEIIVQSAAIYSLVVLIAAISGVLPTSGDFPSPSEWSLSLYSSTLLVPAAGIAPTIMAARVSLASSSNNDLVVSSSPANVLSNLQFERHNGNSTNVNDTHGDNLRVTGYSDHTSPDSRYVEPKHSIQV